MKEKKYKIALHYAKIAIISLSGLLLTFVGRYIHKLLEPHFESMHTIDIIVGAICAAIIIVLIVWFVLLTKKEKQINERIHSHEN